MKRAAGAASLALALLLPPALAAAQAPSRADAALAARREAARKVQAIEIPCKLNGAATKCRLDSGAERSTVPSQGLEDLPVASPRSITLTGGHGIPVQCDSVVLRDNAILGLSAPEFPVVRCPVSIPRLIGQDLLSSIPDRWMRLNLSSGELQMLSSAPAGLARRRFEPDGHHLFRLDVRIGAASFKAILDTGSYMTSVPRAVLAAISRDPSAKLGRRDSFKTFDVSGQGVEAAAYELQSGISIAGIPTGPTWIDTNADGLAEIVLGMDAIAQLQWHIDWGGGEYAVSELEAGE